MIIVAYIASVIGAALCTVTILSQTAFWQRKEYRFDRAWSAIRFGDEHSRPYILYVLLILLVAGVGIFLRDVSVVTGQRAGWIPLLGILLYYGHTSLQRGLARPDLTNKALAVLILSVAGTVAIGLAARQWIAYTSWWWGALCAATPLVVTIAVTCINAPSYLAKRRTIARAKEYRATLKHLDAVGITGSYGKTSTKLFLEQLLVETGHKTIATHKHRNAEFPVAQDMLQQVTKEHQQYIVEMGAYTPGEIAALARMTKPRIGVVTAIGSQHVALFGSLQKLAQAKWELVAALPEDGIAVLNADDKTVTRQRAKFTGNVVDYSLTKPATVWLENASYLAMEVQGVLHVGGDQAKISLPVLGAGMASSAMAAIATAHALGVTLDAMVPILPSLQSPERTMRLATSPTGATIIDDSYSASEGGVLAAIEQLGRFEEPRKIIVIPPLIELGTEAARAHKAIAEAALAINAEVMLYGSTHIEQFRQHVPATTWSQRWYSEADPLTFKNRLSGVLGVQTVVLLAGRVPEVVRAAAVS